MFASLLVLEPVRLLSVVEVFPSLVLSTPLLGLTVFPPVTTVPASVLFFLTAFSPLLEAFVAPEPDLLGP